MPTERRVLTAAVLAIAVAGLLLMLSPHPGIGRDQVLSLLSTTQTILGQPIVYPAEAPAKVDAAIVSMQPGEETGWHQHDVPMFGYVLEGEVTVDYGAKGTRVTATEDLVPALEAAFRWGGVHLVVVPIDYSENTRVLVEELGNKVPEVEPA